MVDDKARLRAWARTLPPPDPAERDRVVAGLSVWLAERSPSRVLTYLAMPGELDLARLTAEHPEFDWAVTRTPRRGPLTIHPVDSAMEVHPYGFRQPVSTAVEIGAEEVDVVLVPGVAFDNRGGRLGRGAGYYDRLLPGLRSDAETIGITLVRFLVDRVPTEPHDVPVAWIATEDGVTPAGRPASP